MILRGMSGACLGHHLRHHLGHVWGIIWGMSGHHLGNIWGIIWGMSGAYLGYHLKACLGQSKISAVLHLSLMCYFLWPDVRPEHCSVQLNVSSEWNSEHLLFFHSLKGIYILWTT